MTTLKLIEGCTMPRLTIGYEANYGYVHVTDDDGEHRATAVVTGAVVCPTVEQWRVAMHRAIDIIAAVAKATDDGKTAPPECRELIQSMTE